MKIVLDWIAEYAAPALGGSVQFAQPDAGSPVFTVLATGPSPRGRRRPVRFDVAPEVLSRLRQARADEFARTGRRLTALTQLALESGGYRPDSDSGVFRILVDSQVLRA